MTTQQLLNISHKPQDAKTALKKAIPSMESGFNVNTIHGDFALHGQDAHAVMELVTRLAQQATKRKPRL